MSQFRWLSVLVVGAVFAPRSAADIVPGVDWHVAVADVIVLGQAQSAREAEAFPPPAGKQRVLVREVLKGFDTSQWWLVPTGSLKPSQEAVLVRPFQAGTHYQPALELTRRGQAAPVTVWPVVGGIVNTNLPLHSQGRPALDNEPLPLQALLNEIARGTPEEAGLYQHLLTAWLTPDKLESAIVKDPERIRYVRIVAAFRDLDRDVAGLADLLESPDDGRRDLAEKRLRALTGADLPTPNEATPKARHEWAESWRGWWEKNRDRLVWDEARSRWRARTKDDPPARHWPEVPANMKRPPDAFPADLVAAIAKKDASAFSVAVRHWLDSGVLRDRQLKYSEMLPQDLKNECHLPHGNGAPARLRPDILFNEKYTAEDRTKVLAYVARTVHFDRFAHERRQALEQVKGAPVGAEIVRRAAFWEMADTNVETPGRLANERLATSDAPADQKMLAALFLAAGPSDLPYWPARQSLDKGHKEFTAALLDHLRQNDDYSAEWAARVLAQSHVPASLPVLVEKLKNPNAHVRKWSAFALCWYPSPDTVPGLLAAIRTEKDAAVRAEIIIALAQTGDARGLDTLLDACKGEIKEKQFAIELARGLGRVKDKKALPALAALAERFEDDQVQSEVVNAFGYVSSRFKGFPPSAYWSGSGMQAEALKKGQADIAKWRTEQSK
jgi:hypothetical protein